MAITENITTIALFLLAVGVLGWGFYRNKDLGKFGILSWLQSVVLMTPWLLSFAAFAAGIYINLAGILVLLVGSTGIYIWLGSYLRKLAQDPEVAAQIAQKLVKYRSTEPAPNLSSNPAIEGDKKPINPIAIEIPHLSGTELSEIKSIFGIDTFFATETIPYQQGAIFRGNLRGEPAPVREKLAEKLTAKCGDKYRLFLVADPEDRPVVVVLPSSTEPQPLTLAQKILAAVMFVATIATTLETVGVFLGFDFYEHTERVGEVWPLALGLWGVLIAHEVGHIAMAKLRQIKLAIPFFLPTGQIGAFGSITRFASLVPDRRTLFDVAISGPAAGGLVSLGMLSIGFLLSNRGVGLDMPTQFFQGSILVGTLAKVFLGGAIHQTIVKINPLVIIGWLGLVINALNLLPAGQLDGGRIVQAIYGRKTAQRTTIATLVILALVALFSAGNPLILYWLILVGLLQRSLERPTLDEITEPDDTRAALGLLALFISIAILLPFSPDLAGRLGIGG
jgi:membrane-associated protease RseP (regulator of RpoE activity)